MSRHLVSIVGNSFNCSLGAMAGNTETLVRHCLVGAHAAGCAQAEPQTATDGTTWYCMVLNSIARFYPVLPGIA